MTIHKLSAGDGYTYLTKHVATGDATESKVKDAVDYHVAKGTPPGVWCGRMAAAVGVEPGAVVTESGMRSVFGAARTPNALDTRPGPDAPLGEDLAWSRQTALGRAFSWFENSQEFINDVEECCSEHKARHGVYPQKQAKAAIQLVAARRHLRRARGEAADLLSDEVVTGWIVEQYAKIRQPVAGYDLVFTPVKSISLLWGLGDQRVRVAVEEAHRQAVDETLEWIEDEVIYTRRGAGGKRLVKADGVLIARFDHFDNRAGDPNLHTHAAVANRVRAEGTWTTIDGRVMYKATVSASERYNTRVADLVGRRLGVTFAPRPGTPVGKQPVYEVEGIPVSLLEEFSRRAQIEQRQEELAAEYKARFGKNPPKAVQYAQAQQATLDTRNAKNPPRSLGELRAEWRERAAALLAGGEPSALVEDVRHGSDRRPVFDAAMLPEVVTEVIDHLSRRVGSWTVFSLSAEVERRMRAYSFVDDNGLREHVADALELALRDHCLFVGEENRTAPDRIGERVEGGLVRLHDVDRTQMRYTSPSVLDAERFMREQADTADRLVVTARVIRRHLRSVEDRSGHRLSADQVEMIEHFLTAGTRVAVAVGAAGAGKTTAAMVIARAWESSCGNVVALGPSARSAEVLGKAIGVEGRTIAEVLTRARAGIPTGVAAGDLLLVDEAGMASARDLADLTRVAADVGAVVRLLGDPQQLAAVESSGVLRDLAERTRAPFLAQVHRFSTEGEATATLRLRDGAAGALDWYDRHGRIREGMRHELPDLVFDAYLADVEAGAVTLMVAPTSELVRELNSKAAAYYRAVGSVTGPAVVLTDGLEAAVGDVVVTRKNSSKYVVKNSDGHRAGRVKNGDLWTVTAIGVDGALVLRSNAGGGLVAVPADYVADNVQLGYATTVHRSQGMTVARCHVLASASMDRQTLYVAMTRGKNSNIVYAAHDELPDWDFEHRPDDHPTARGLLEKIVGRDGSQRTVHEMLEGEHARAESWDRLTSAYGITVTALYEDLTEKLLCDLLTEQQFSGVHQLGGWDQIVEQVARAETYRWDTRSLLAEAAAVMRAAGQAGDIDTGENAPGRVLARALDDATTGAGESVLPRHRSDDIADYALPALSDDGAGMDQVLAAYARSYQQQMHGYIDMYIASATEAGDRWLTALGNPGDDPRKRHLWQRAIREVAISRVIANAPTSDTDPYLHLRESRVAVVAGRVAAVTSGAAAETVYAGYTTAQLHSARQVARQRLVATRQQINLASTECARARAQSEVAAVDAMVADRATAQQSIDTIRAARAELDRLRLSGIATDAELAVARRAVIAAEAGGPLERRWPVVERTTRTDPAAEMRRAAAARIDERIVGRITARITTLEGTLLVEQRRLQLLEQELQRRPGASADQRPGPLPHKDCGDPSTPWYGLGAESERTAQPDPRDLS
ncbi:MobF family relaxase [Rhodococcus triatomae]